jgi:hypothetical protein
MTIYGLPFAYLCTAAPASSVAAQSATASLEALLRDVRALNQEMGGSLVGRATAVESTDSRIQDDAKSPLGALVRNVDALREVLHSDENKKQKSPISKFGIAGGKGPEAFNPENPIRKGFRACLSVG